MDWRIVAQKSTPLLLNTLTGWDFGPEELLTIGDRSVNLKRSINSRFGVTRDHDLLPKICLKPLSEDTTDGIRPDMEMELFAFYRLYPSCHVLA
jgi:aldehyde:ferredoxin oxidoreductase